MSAIAAPTFEPRYCTTHVGSPVADLEADQAATLASVHRAGSPAAVGSVAPTAVVTCNGGASVPRTVPRRHLLTRRLAAGGLRRAGAGVRGPRLPSALRVVGDDDATIAYARKAPSGGRLSQPVLFVNGDWEGVCRPGYWLSLEREAEHIQSLRTWLQTEEL